MRYQTLATFNNIRLKHRQISKVNKSEFSIRCKKNYDTFTDCRPKIDILQISDKN